MSIGSKKVWRLLVEASGLLARLLLGGMFIYAGLNKALDPIGFLKLLRQYELVHTPVLLNSIAGVLPWFEVFCGVLLVGGIGVRGSGFLLVTMLVPFTVIVLRRALEIQAVTGLAFCAVKFDCGCGTGEVYICRKLVENGLMILLSLWLVCGYGRKFALRYNLFGQSEI